MSCITILCDGHLRIVYILSNVTLTMSDLIHSIRVVAQRTGLSPHVIRVWEKRYGAVRPSRTETNRRLYSEAEVERLSLLKRVIGAGHSIGNVAGLEMERLRSLVEHEPAPGDTRLEEEDKILSSAESFLAECLRATRELDSTALNHALQAGNVKLGAQGLLQQVVGPLVQRLGTLWRAGELTAAHEHFATGVIRTFLGKGVSPFVSANQHARLIVATPAGQLHELGALLVYAAATNLGWRVIYLGASLPAAEIAGAALQNGVRAVALSIVYPEDDPQMDQELRRLRQLLPPEVSLIVGGRAAEAYRMSIESIGAFLIADLNALCSTLDQLRRPAKQGAA